MQTKKLIVLPAVVAAFAFAGCETSARTANSNETEEPTLADTSVGPSTTNTTQQHVKTQLSQTDNNVAAEDNEERVPKVPHVQRPNLPRQRETEIIVARQIKKRMQYPIRKGKKPSTVAEDVKKHFLTLSEDLTKHANAKFVDEVISAADDYHLHGMDQVWIKKKVEDEYKGMIFRKMGRGLYKYSEDWRYKYAHMINRLDKLHEEGRSREEIRITVMGEISNPMTDEGQYLSSLLERYFAMYDMQMEFDKLLLSGVPPSEVAEKMMHMRGEMSWLTMSRHIIAWLEEYHNLNNKIQKLLRSGDVLSPTIWKEVKLPRRRFSTEENQLFISYVKQICEDYIYQRTMFFALFLNNMHPSEIRAKMASEGFPQKATKLNTNAWLKEHAMMNDKIENLLLQYEDRSKIWEMVKPTNRPFSPEENQRYSHFVDQMCEEYDKTRAKFDGLLQSGISFKLADQPDLYKTTNGPTVSAKQWFQEHVELNKKIDEKLLSNTDSHLIWEMVKPEKRQFSNEEYQSFYDYVIKRSEEYEAMKYEFDELLEHGFSEKEIHEILKGADHGLLNIETEIIDNRIHHWLGSDQNIDNKLKS